MLRANVNRWQTHLESTQMDEARKSASLEQQARKRPHATAFPQENGQETHRGPNSCGKIMAETQDLQSQLQGLKLSQVRKLPIVGDVHLAREQWPQSPQDWNNLWSLGPKAIRLSKIVYSVNRQRKAFDMLGLVFAGQKFKSFELSATEHAKRLVCHVKLRHPITTVKIK